jgi:hypothetical protein
MDITRRTRVRIAQEAARIMAEEGINDHRTAKRKAASRLSLKTVRHLPHNDEIDDALLEYHRLYRMNVQCRHISRLRKLAVEAMEFLKDFAPRLVGSVLDGSAGEFSPITLHLLSETPEDVIRKLLDSGIRFNTGSHGLDLGKGQLAALPKLSFWVDDTEICLVIFTPAQRWKGLGKPGTEKSAVSASIKEVQRLVSGMSHDPS